MNLESIERRFECLTEREKQYNYFFDPECQIIPGKKKHYYVKEMAKDKHDIHLLDDDPEKQMRTITDPIEDQI
jgi:hypothetical protein